MNLKTNLRSRLHGFVHYYRQAFTHYLFFPVEPFASNYAIKDAVTDFAPDGLPAPPESLWVGYGSTIQEYIESGKQHVDLMFKATGRSDYHNVLDFGCAAGRMTRHLTNTEVWGVDISAKHINWCKQHLPMKFATVTTVPHLPFPDRYFDLIFAGSVFTHIDDLADAWLLELNRVCRGDLFVTIHDETTSALLETDEFNDLYIARHTRSSPFYNANRHDSQMLTIGRDTLSQVFYKQDYFIKMLEQSFDVMTVDYQAHRPHTSIVARVRQ